MLNIRLLIPLIALLLTQRIEVSFGQAARMYVLQDADNPYFPISGHDTATTRCLSQITASLPATVDTLYANQLLSYDAQSIETTAQKIKKAQGREAVAIAYGNQSVMKAMQPAMRFPNQVLICADSLMLYEALHDTTFSSRRLAINISASNLWSVIAKDSAGKLRRRKIAKQNPEALKRLIAQWVNGNEHIYTMRDFFDENSMLDKRVDEYYDGLNDTQRVSQMLITSIGKLGKPMSYVTTLVAKEAVGGIIMMRNSKSAHIRSREILDSIVRTTGGVPLLYSMDAEPSLFKSRITGAPKVPKSIDLQTEATCRKAVSIIDKELIDIGVRYNFAPVVDLSPNNVAIKDRSFGSNPKVVVKQSSTYISATQGDQIIATAKHFPGHGLVTGDTHKGSVYIDGELQELDVFRQVLKESKPLSVMVAHITIKNNPKYDTKGMPSSISRNIVTGLLKEELNYKGLVVTDALNHMLAVSKFGNAALAAAKADNDLLLMLDDEEATVKLIIAETEKSEAFKKQIETSVKKVLRAKFVLGLI